MFDYSEAFLLFAPRTLGVSFFGCWVGTGNKPAFGDLGVFSPFFFGAALLFLASEPAFANAAATAREFAVGGTSSSSSAETGAEPSEFVPDFMRDDPPPASVRKI